MNCQNVKKIIPIFLDRELAADEQIFMEAHLKSCAACQKEVELYRRSWEMLKDVPQIQPEPAYVSRFWTRLAQEKTWHERLALNIREGLLKRNLVPAFVALCLLVAAGLFSVTNYFRIQDTEQILAEMSEEEVELVENIELAQDFEIIADLELLEDLEILEYWDTAES